MSLNLSLCDENSPSNDFYKYVNNDWMKNNSIPDDFQRWSIFNILNEENRDKIKKLLDDLTYSTNKEYNSLKVLYDQGLNLEEINSKSCHDYMKDKFTKISKIKSKEELLNFIFNTFVKHGINTPFVFSVYSDFSNSDHNILHIFTDGLGLPDRDYYIDSDKTEISEKYQEFMKEYTKLFQINLDLKKIYQFEEELAKVTHTRVEKRDPNILNNPTSYQEVKSKYSSLPIKNLFDYLEKDNGKINISNLKFLDKYQELWEVTDISILKDYYTWTLINNLSDYINEKALKTKFDFYGKILSGTPELLPRWKRIISNCNSKLGVIIGKIFVDKYFPKEAKSKALNMVGYIKQELKNRLKNNDWMESSTKSKALEKLSKMNVKIGYPDKQKDYSKLVLSLKNSYLENNLTTLKFLEDKQWEKLYQDKDRNEWFMDPQTVNAYYSPTNNEIVFPAGILQKPFFDKNYDAPLNFGGIGSVIGHEITHGFDDKGRMFDSNGNLNDWWTKDDAEEYKNKVKKLRDQYANYKIEGKNLNGDLTLGENIADLGGVSISYYSLINYLKDNVNENRILEGFTPQQRFFFNYAKIWRCNTRKEEIHKRLITDPHSPPIFRVNGVVTNLKEFYDAFNVNEGDKLWKDKEDRINIW